MWWVAYLAVSVQLTSSGMHVTQVIESDRRSCQLLADAQLTSPHAAVCVGKQVVFSCQQDAGTTVWNINWPAGMTLSGTALSEDVGNITNLGSGFEIHIISVSSNGVLTSELRVTAARELNNIAVTCRGTMTYTSTIQIALVGEFLVTNQLTLSSCMIVSCTMKIHQLLQVES